MDFLPHHSQTSVGALWSSFFFWAVGVPQSLAPVGWDDASNDWVSAGLNGYFTFFHATMAVSQSKQTHIRSQRGRALTYANKNHLSKRINLFKMTAELTSCGLRDTVFGRDARTVLQLWANEMRFNWGFVKQRGSPTAKAQNWPHGKLRNRAKKKQRLTHLTTAPNPRKRPALKEKKTDVQSLRGERV